MQKKGTHKWGSLDEDTKKFNVGRRRKVRQVDMAKLSPYYHEDSETPQFTLEEYEQYLASRKLALNNKNSNVNTSGLSREKYELISRAHKNMLDKNKPSDSDAQLQVTAFLTSVEKRNYKELELLADEYLRFDLPWTHPQLENFVNTVIQTNDHKIYDLIFLTRSLHHYHSTDVTTALYNMYRATNVDDAQAMEKMHNILLYFLDIGGNYMTSYHFQTFIESLAIKRDIKLWKLMLNHEAIHKATFTCRKALFTFVEHGNSAAPLIDMLLEEKPQLLELTESVYDRPAGSPLFVAAQKGHTQLVELLLNKGANPNFCAGKRGKRVIEVAANDAIKEMLQNKGVKPVKEQGAVGGKALKRIMRDWLEIMRDPPSDTVRAIPDEKNMFKWHVVITPPSYDHPLSGCNFHFTMRFPLNYPDAPPAIKGSQYLPHPNYFGGYLCLNMLRPQEMGSKYSGWSCGYSALSILMQLQSFLFADEVDQDYGYTEYLKILPEEVKEVHLECIKFKCSKCGFNHKWRGYELDDPDFGKKPNNATAVLREKFEFQKTLPFMGPPDYGHVEDPSTWAKKKSPKIVSNASLLSIPDYALVEIMDYLVRIEDLVPMLRVCKHIQRVGEKYAIWTRRELVCYYSKVGFMDDVLGVGVTVQRGGGGKIKTLTSPMDMLARTAFFHDYLRTSTWQEKFDYWLPLIINERHAEKAITYLQATIVAIIYDVSFEIDDTTTASRAQGIDPGDSEETEEKLLALAAKFQPLMVLDILPKLMNHTIVAMMRDTSDDEQVYLHHSEKALLGYCSYHHILLEMCRRYPEVQKKIDHVLEQFYRHESARVKLVQPDLGELLVYLSVASKVTWHHIGQAFVQELLDRNVVWIFDSETGKGHGELAYLENMEVSNYRLNTTFTSSTTGLRLLMFQVFFLEKVGRPPGLTPRDVLKRLNDSYGRPRAGIPTLLQKECEKIYKVNSWPGFFARIGVPCPGKPQMTKILRQAVMNSERKGYHINRMEPMELFKWRINADREFADSKPTPPNAENGSEQSKDPSPAEAAQMQAHVKGTQARDAAQASQEKGTQPQGTTQAKGTQVNAKDARPQTKPVKIFVGNLSFRVTALDLEYVFQQFGKLVSSQVMYDENGKSRGFGFIEVENEDIASTLLEFMQGADVDRRPVRLEKVDRNKPFKPRTDRTPENGTTHPTKQSNSHSNYNSNSHPKSNPKPAPKKEEPQKPQKPQKPQNASNKKNTAQYNPFANLDEE